MNDINSSSESQINQNLSNALLSVNNSQNSLISTLHSIWKNEKLSQDLLQYQEVFITKIINLIESREKEFDNTKYEKEDGDGMEGDLQRIKFIGKDYFRIRLCKIEKYLLYILKNDGSNLLSQNEMKFVVELINMKSVYFNEGGKNTNNLVNNFRPFGDKYKTMSDKISAVNEGMIVNPPNNDYVIIESNTNENLIGNMKDVYEDSEQEYLVIKEGDVVAVPFDIVKDYIKNGKVSCG